MLIEPSSTSRQHIVITWLQRHLSLIHSFRVKVQSFLDWPEVYEAIMKISSCLFVWCCEQLQVVEADDDASLGSWDKYCRGEAESRWLLCTYQQLQAAFTTYLLRCMQQQHGPKDVEKQVATWWGGGLLAPSEDHLFQFVVDMTQIIKVKYVVYDQPEPPLFHQVSTKMCLYLLCCLLPIDALSFHLKQRNVLKMCAHT